MIKDKKTKTMTFRLTEEEYSYLEQSAYLMGTSASKFVRQLIQMAINTTKLAQKRAEEDKKTKEELSVINEK